MVITVLEELNGQTQKTTCGLERCLASPQSERLGTVSLDGSINGAKSLGVGEQDCSGNYSTGGDAYDECTPIGKILQRLEQLESAFLEYLGAQKSCFEARLDVNRLSREVFLRQVAELKQEIYNLATDEPLTGSNENKD
ncbi:hypothetical protein [Nodularia sphaerocarpa]|uniref:hypothetical protein n=1 Tax=Nodularia sphaerocarpa TaxID=137816 RepID=UPI001EFAF4BD|nr:hypothetical protein [Nodularia sphaerocarpa]MDB9374140.1 hypothetical protein [Nodularia sphaerocarpa CS-585]MDB9377724.1 hypothetical protein [Nodularia sphaerocarpa CS-585A2]